MASFAPDEVRKRIPNALLLVAAESQTGLENDKQSYARAFVQRNQFTSAFPTSMSPATFVEPVVF